MNKILSIVFATTMTAVMALGQSLIITEVIQNPSAVSDSNGEWFEIYNPSETGVNIDGYTIEDAGSNSHVIDNGGSLVVPAEGFIVLGKNTDTATNGGAPVDYAFGGSMDLSNGDDEIILLDASSNEVTRIEWDGGPNWPDPNGASMILTDPLLDPNLGGNWAESTNAWIGGDGDFGSPGAANEGWSGSSPSNQPPVLDPIGSQTVIVSNELAFTVTASDLVDGNLVTLTATNLPGGASFPETNGTPIATGNFTWTPMSTGVFSVLFNAADTNGNVSETVEITVTDSSTPSGTPWINEIHYDNSGTDVGEFVEVAGPAGTDLTGYSLVPYNGNGGTEYSSTPITGTIADEGCGYGALSFEISGLQNGDPDGVALVDGSSTLIQFLSYGGSFTATDGPANGQTSIDIGVTEPGAIGESLQLTGSGTMYTDFSWIGPTNESPGSLNDNQLIDGCGGASNQPPVFAAISDQMVIVSNELSFGVSATDAVDSDFVSLVVSGEPTNATFNATPGSPTASGTFIWTPTQVETVTVSFVATDPDGSVTQDVQITVNEPAPLASNAVVRINEVRADDAGADDIEFVELIGTTGTDLAGYQLIHYNGNGGGQIWAYVFPAFTIPDDVTLDTNGNALGFVVIGNGSVGNNDLSLPDSLQGGEDGLVLYNAETQVVDAVAWDGVGDLATELSGVITVNPPSEADNFLHVTQDDSGDDNSLQAPDNVVGDTGAGWTGEAATPGAANGSQTSGNIVLEAVIAGDLPPVLSLNPSDTNQTITVNSTLDIVVSVTEFDGDSVTLSATGVPPEATFTNQTGLAPLSETFSFSPTSTGTYSVIFTATDTDGSDTITVDLEVEPEPVAGGRLVISQYTETESGSIPKGIELWNVSGSDITFDSGPNRLVVNKGINGDPLAEDVAVESGTVLAGDVFVIGTSNMSPDVVYAFTFNGDDALSVELGGILEDVFGLPGQDPGSAWTGNSVSTSGQNLQLLDGIFSGDADGWTDPSERFENIGLGSDLTGFGTPPAGTDDPPTISFNPTNNPTEVVLGQTLEVDVTAFEVDGETVDLEATTLPLGATFTNQTGVSPLTGTLFFTPSSSGQETLTFEASDTDGTNTVNLVVDVLEQPAPMFVDVQDHLVLLNDTLTFDVTVQETDGDPITSLTASNLPGTATFTPGVGNTTGTFEWVSASPVGVYTVEFYAVDNDGTSVATSIVTVAEVSLADVVLNEIFTDHPIDDDLNEFIELRGAPSEDLSGLTLLEIDGDSQGIIDHVLSLNGVSLGTNGFLIIGEQYEGFVPYTLPNGTAVLDLDRTPNANLENGTISFLLVDNFTGAVGEDVDANDDGTMEYTPWTTVIDSVGWDDNGASDYVYASAALDLFAGAPDAASRIRGSTNRNDAADWFYGIISTSAVDSVGISYVPASSENLPDSAAVLTPGDLNYISTNLPSPPLLSVDPGGTTKTAVVDVAFSFDIVVEEDDGDTVTLSALEIPGGSTFPTVNSMAPITNAFDWTPTVEGTVTSRFEAVDGDGTNTLDIVIEVIPQQPPSILPVGDQEVTINNDLIFDVTVLPTEGDAVTSLSALNLPGDATFAPGDGFNTNAVFTWTNASPVGVYTTQVVAVDNDGASTNEIVITVKQPFAGSVLLNEILVNPDGSDDNREYIELIGNPGEVLTNVTVLALEADAVTAQGEIEFSVDLNGLALGANGLMAIGSGYETTTPWTNMPTATTLVDLPSSLENGAITFLLVSDYTGSNGQDLDTDDNGTLDNQPWGTTIDSVGWNDAFASGAVYTPAEVAVVFAQPGAVTRIVGDTSDSNASSWYGGVITAPAGDTQGITYDPGASTANTPTDAVLTPGDENFGAPSGGNDSDNDGIDDQWELDNGLSVGTDNSGASNSDTDSLTDVEEYILDTDPTTSNEVFLLENIMLSAGDQMLTFSPASTARVYTILYDDDLITPPDFQPLPGAVKIPGTNSVMSLIDTNAVDQRTYRIRVEVE